MLQRLGAFLRSSIGKKALMSLTGLALIGFLFAHLAGNLLLFTDESGARFDAYAATLEGNFLLPAAEIGLLILFAVHIALGLRAAGENREARPARYKELAPHGNRTGASTTMIVTGLIVLLFLVVHLLDFRLATRDPQGLAAMVVARMAGPIGAAVYLVGVIALGVHLWHAFQSALQTLGVGGRTSTPALKRLGFAIALVLGLGFALFPVVGFLFPREAEARAEQAAGQDAQAPAAVEGH